MSALKTCQHNLTHGEGSLSGWKHCDYVFICQKKTNTWQPWLSEPPSYIKTLCQTCIILRIAFNVVHCVKSIKWRSPTISHLHPFPAGGFIVIHTFQCVGAGYTIETLICIKLQQQENVCGNISWLRLDCRYTFTMNLISGPWLPPSLCLDVSFQCALGRLQLGAEIHARLSRPHLHLSIDGGATGVGPRPLKPSAPPPGAPTGAAETSSGPGERTRRR